MNVVIGFGFRARLGFLKVFGKKFLFKGHSLATELKYVSSKTKALTFHEKNKCCWIILLTRTNPICCMIWGRLRSTD